MLKYVVKTKISSERREVFEGLASRAAKLLRAAAYCARAPVALAWDARCDPVEVAALLEDRAKAETPAIAAPDAQE